MSDNDEQTDLPLNEGVEPKPAKKPAARRGRPKKKVEESIPGPVEDISIAEDTAPKKKGRPSKKAAKKTSKKAARKKEPVADKAQDDDVPMSFSSKSSGDEGYVRFEGRAIDDELEDNGSFREPHLDEDDGDFDDEVPQSFSSDNDDTDEGDSRHKFYTETDADAGQGNVVEEQTEGAESSDNKDVADSQDENYRNNNNKNRHNKNNKFDRNRDKKAAFKKGKKFQKNQDRQPNQQKNQKFQKQQQKFGKSRGFQLYLTDGLQMPANGLVFGDLPKWDVIRNLEDLEGLAEEYLSEANPIDFDRLYSLPLNELREKVIEMGADINSGAGRVTVLQALLDHAIANQNMLEVSGCLELLDNGHGLIVYASDDYKIKEYSVFVSEALVTEYNLKRGAAIKVIAHPPRDGETCPYALRITNVNGLEPAAASQLTPFTELTPYYPLERIFLETDNDVSWDNGSMRIVDLLTPIGLGQRGLIVAPPRTGKTVLMQGMANAIARNKPEAKLLILLIDERPEEVTDFKRNCAGQVVASTFDASADSHVHAAEMVIAKARRMVEAGEHVVILLDSITRLARAYNTMMPSSGKILSGGVEANAMQRPKRFFGSARNIEGGGSLTILATALIETGSRMDEVIFEEFKGTGNMELHLDRALVDKRIFPALSFEKCGTRKEELLYHKDEMLKIYSLRRAMKGVPSTEAMEMLIQRVKKTKSNPEFLMGLSR